MTEVNEIMTLKAESKGVKLEFKSYFRQQFIQCKKMADEVVHENMISYLTKIMKKVSHNPVFNQFLDAGH